MAQPSRASTLCTLSLTRAQRTGSRGGGVACGRGQDKAGLLRDARPLMLGGAVDATHVVVAHFLDEECLERGEALRFGAGEVSRLVRIVGEIEELVRAIFAGHDRIARRLALTVRLSGPDWWSAATRWAGARTAF